MLDNFTNRATTSSFAAHYERDLTDRDRLGFIVRHEQTVFQVPNEFLQQAAGQRQDRDSNETIGILSYQHVFSSNVLGDFRLMSRDDSSGLSSNQFFYAHYRRAAAQLPRTLCQGQRLDSSWHSRDQGRR